MNTLLKKISFGSFEWPYRLSDKTTCSQQEKLSSILSRATVGCWNSGLAQLVELSVVTRMVSGSSPESGAKFIPE